MKTGRRFTSAMRTLTHFRARTALAAAAVAVGVAAVILSRAVGVGAQREMNRTMERMGTNLLLVKPLPLKPSPARPQIRGSAMSLSVADCTAIEALPLVHEAAPAIEGSVRVKAGPAAMKTTVRGTTPAYPLLRRFTVRSGRFFTGDDDRHARRVAVLGARVDEALGDGHSLVGEVIRIHDIPFDVIGTLAAKGTTADGDDEDNQVLIPLRTALRRVFNVHWLTTVYVSVTEPARMTDAQTDLQHLLRARHERGTRRSPDDIAVQNTAKTRALQQQVTESLSRYATGLGLIALFVGGVGIMALMLVSVRERTSEIGLRMAVGARPGDILVQFLIESSGLALAGWVAGLLLAAVGLIVLAFTSRWTLAIPTSATFASFAMAVGIGLGFGALPARQAAATPPIHTLRQT